MWTMTVDGFFSATEPFKQPDSDVLQVRARKRLDLNRMLDRMELKDQVKIIVGGGTDYPYRVILNKEVWAEYLAKAAREIDYSNFKNTIPLEDRIRHTAYCQCWSALTALNPFPQTTMFEFIDSGNVYDLNKM